MHKFISKYSVFTLLMLCALLTQQTISSQIKDTKVYTQQLQYKDAKENTQNTQEENTNYVLKKKAARLEKDINEQEKSIFLSKLTTWLSIALILILSLLTLSLYKNNNLRAKANKLLQDKNTELQAAKIRAEKASQVKGQFLSTITHELRTPMYTVSGLTHLLLDEDLNPEQKELLNTLKLSSEHLLSLINNLLDLNKLEANKFELERVSFSLKKRIKDILVSLKNSADTKNNIINYDYDTNLPNNVIGDALKISQILINLISNSIKFTENGTIWVRVQKVENTSQNLEILFEVEDTGVGISKKKQNTIFDSFSQGSLQINRKYGGTGLGLSIVKNMLELMGSEIFLHSQLGKGSKFWFNLSYDAHIENTKSIELNETKVILDNDIFENKKVLIVEDNKVNQLITKKILTKKKIICTVADNGTDAVKIVKKETFDIILMDLHMPGISGIEATKKIRGFNTTVPIIALTAISIDENSEIFRKAGFTEFIPKPFKAEEFFDKINRVLLKQ